VRFLIVLCTDATLALPTEEAGWFPPSVRPLVELVPGARLDRYQLLAQLGQGGMAIVFRARDSWLRRQVAIKVQNAATAEQHHAEQWFRREALALAALNHPNVLQVFDFVPATGSNPSYLVSELVPGPTLRHLLDRHQGRLSPPLAAVIAGQLAEALHAVHAAGIVHRDVKPENVLVAPTGDGGARVVLTDFGVADVVGLPPFAPPGALVGSPAYMSPEQARGEPVGPASDQWALGLLLYEMATGRLPASPRPRDLAPGVGRELDDICARCLQLRPERRHPDAAALARRLGRFCRERSIGLRDLGPLASGLKVPGC
jgi:serine/threonine protein kinase